MIHIAKLITSIVFSMNRTRGWIYVKLSSSSPISIVYLAENGNSSKISWKPIISIVVCYNIMTTAIGNTSKILFSQFNRCCNIVYTPAGWMWSISVLWWTFQNLNSMHLVRKRGIIWIRSWVWGWCNINFVF